LECPRLKNGTYIAKHTSPKKAIDYHLKISDGKFTIKIKDTINLKGKITQLDNCLISFEGDKVSTDTTEFGKTLHASFGNAIIELKNTARKKTYFRTTYSGNLHITINEGYFFKVK
jgi:hypothetical protein